MRRAAAMMVLVMAVLALGAWGARTAAPSVQTSPEVQPAASAVKFGYVDLFADCGAEALGAYQLEIVAELEGGTVRLVGVEGGDAAASAGKGAVFAEPPVYDPEALTRDHIVLAAYTSRDAGELPTGRFRVARLHVQVEAGAGGAGWKSINANVKPTYRVRVIAAGRADGTRVAVKFEAVPGETK